MTKESILEEFDNIFCEIDEGFRIFKHKYIGKENSGMEEPIIQDIKKFIQSYGEKMWKAGYNEGLEDGKGINL